MSDILTPGLAFGVGTQVYPTPTLGLEMVGAYVSKPPQTADDHSVAFVAPHGTLLNRSVYSILWMTAQKMGWVQSEENWQAAKALSTTGSVAFYSEGTDGTNFRTPDIGATGGFPRYLGSDGSAPVGGIETGFDWQIENITASFKSTKYNAGSSSGAFTDSGGSFGHTLPSGSYFTGGTTFSFDASKVVKTGDETTPQGFYQKLFIYTGADITPPAASPSLEQILAASSYPKLLWNTDLGGSPVNQKEFDGNWAALAQDEQGWDLWRKYDNDNIFQVVPDGRYIPNIQHILQYNGVVVWKGLSPASGNWGIIVPNTVVKVDFRAGFTPIPWHPEESATLRTKCLSEFERIAAYQIPVQFWTTGNVGRATVPIQPKSRDGIMRAGFTRVSNYQYGGAADTTDVAASKGYLENEKLVSYNLGKPGSTSSSGQFAHISSVNGDPWFDADSTLKYNDVQHWTSAN